MSSKIVQLQGLRCIAIVSVLLYHVWPNVFTNGFMGVDVFFVISGYIMARILLSSDSLKTNFFTTSLNFYYRRIYRILPIYLLYIFISILIVPTISYSSTTVDNLFFQVVTVLTFTKNFDNVAKFRSYFNHALSIDMFTHYWSLCVEMQFYFLAPFLLYFCKHLPLLVNLFILWPILIIACVTFIVYQIFTYQAYGLVYIFYMLPAKIYEFFAGFIAYHIQDWTVEYFSERKIKLKIRYFCHHVITLNILMLILMVIVFWPRKFDDSIAIPFHIGFTIATVVITAAIISLIGKTEKSKDELQFSILAQEMLVFIGNSSYSLYIFHWIFIVISKAMLEETQQNNQVILILCFLTGCLVHKYIEKPIINARLPWKVTMPSIILSYAIICLFAYSTDYERSPSKFAKEIYTNHSKFISNSSEWRNIASSITPEISSEVGIYSGEIGCHHYPRSKWVSSIKEVLADGAEFEGTGNLSVLVIGNSHAICETPGIKLAMEGLYSQLSFVAIGGVTPFEGFQNSGAWFIFKNAVNHYKPDIIFLIFKYLTDFEDPSTDTDYHMMKVQEMITFLSDNSKVFFISGPQVQYDSPKFYSIKFTEMIYNHGWVNSYKVNQIEIEEKHAVLRKRWNGIKCKNCIFYDRLKAFCKNDWCSPLDETRKVPLFFDSDHVTLFGAHLLSKYVKNHFPKMFQLLLRDSGK